LTKNTLEYYLSLKYPYEIVEDESGGYFAQHRDLDGCAAQGESIEETVEALEEARRLWLEVRYEDGLPIPEPRLEEEYSGRVSLRMSRSLHAKLARFAEREGVSLNQLLNTALAEYAGVGFGVARAAALLGSLENQLDRLAKATPQGERPWEDRLAEHRAAILLFENGEQAAAKNLLRVLPDWKKSVFLLGLLHLMKKEKGSIEGLRLVSAAYKAGLTDEEATTVSFCLPGKAGPDVLRGRLIPLSHLLDKWQGDTPRGAENRDLERSLRRLAAWVEKERENYDRAMRYFEKEEAAAVAEDFEG
jgi:predicted RNase H-like HicB family nuclease